MIFFFNLCCNLNNKIYGLVLRINFILIMLKQFKHLCLYIVTDIVQEDLIHYFEDIFQFIKEGQEKGVVLVHW